MDTIISAVISGGLALLGVVITSVFSNNKISSQLDKHQAVTDTKIEYLTSEVREHNNFAKRMPVVESELKRLNERIKILEDTKHD